MDTKNSVDGPADALRDGLLASGTTLEGMLTDLRERREAIVLSDRSFEPTDSSLQRALDEIRDGLGTSEMSLADMVIEMRQIRESSDYESEKRGQSFEEAKDATFEQYDVAMQKLAAIDEGARPSFKDRCPECKGTGRCPACKGEGMEGGSTFEGDPECRRCHKYGWCQTCRGNGEKPAASDGGAA